jgi:hypothetical protein
MLMAFLIVSSDFIPTQADAQVVVVVNHHHRRHYHHHYHHRRR